MTKTKLQNALARISFPTFISMFYIVLGAMLPITVYAWGTPTDPGIDIGKDGLIPMIRNIINVLLALLGILCVILIIWAGFKILTARENEEEYKKGLKIIMYAAIGLAVIFLAWGITTFIFAVVAGTTPQQ